MNKSFAFFMIAASTLAAPAIGRRDQGIPEAKPLGAPVQCIPLSQIRESRVRSDTIIDFRTSGKRWYRNTLPRSCPSLGFEERFSYATSQSELCSVDIITVLYSTPVSRGASCGLGLFQPVELLKRP